MRKNSAFPLNSEIVAPTFWDKLLDPFKDQTNCTKMKHDQRSDQISNKVSLDDIVQKTSNCEKDSFCSNFKIISTPEEAHNNVESLQTTLTSQTVRGDDRAKPQHIPLSQALLFNQQLKCFSLMNDGAAITLKTEKRLNRREEEKFLTFLPKVFHQDHSDYVIGPYLVHLCGSAWYFHGCLKFGVED